MNLGYHHKGGVLRDMGNNNLWSGPYETDHHIKGGGMSEIHERSRHNPMGFDMAPLADWENVILHDQKSQFSAEAMWKHDEAGMMNEKPEFNKAPGAPIRQRNKSQPMPNNPFPPSIHHPPAPPMTTNGYGQQLNDVRNGAGHDYRSYDFGPSQNHQPVLPRNLDFRQQREMFDQSHRMAVQKLQMQSQASLYRNMLSQQALSQFSAAQQPGTLSPSHMLPHQNTANIMFAPKMKQNQARFDIQTAPTSNTIPLNPSNNFHQALQMMSGMTTRKYPQQFLNQYTIGNSQTYHGAPGRRIRTKEQTNLHYALADCQEQFNNLKKELDIRKICERDNLKTEELCHQFEVEVLPIFLQKSGHFSGQPNRLPEILESINRCKDARNNEKTMQNETSTEMVKQALTDLARCIRKCRTLLWSAKDADSRYTQ